MSKRYQAVRHSNQQVREEVIGPSYNDLPWQNAGARRFYLLLLVAFLLFYPVLDPILFGYGTSGRLAAYGDAGYYVILALGLNIVVGFAGLLDLGYVAFFAIGAYSWGIVSPDDFNFGDSIIYLSMIVIGGIGSIPGVIVGALVAYGINELVLSQLDALSSNSGNIFYSVTIAIDHVAPGFTFGNIRNLIFGLLLVLLMIFRPEGLIPNVRRRSTLRILKQKEQKIRADNHDERVEMVPLDVKNNEPDVDEGLHIEKL